VYLDECGATEYYAREYGLAPRGEKVYGEVSGKRYKRTNIISAQCMDEIIAPYVYDWPTKSAWFEEWFGVRLCPLLSLGKVIIMDNALFHRKPVLEKIAVGHGLRIIWLPPYSPDLNRIEKLWANLKKWLKSFADTFDNIQDALWYYLIVG
jgi:hypothetical protein